MYEQFKHFIAVELLRDREYPLDNDQSLIRGGIIDSMSLVQLGLFIEETFHFHVPDRDLTVDKMDTIDQMVVYVQKRLSAKKQ